MTEISEISNLNAGPQQTNISTTYTKITQFDTVGVAKAIVVSDTEKNLTIQRDGVYLISSTISFNGTTSTTYQITVFKNDVEQQNLTAISKLASGTDVQNISITGLVIVNVNDVIDIRVKADAAGKTFTIQKANLILVRVR